VRNGDHATTAARIEVLSGFQTRRGGAGREEGGGGGAGEGASSEATGAPPRLRVARGRWVVPEAEVDEDGGKKLELCVARCWRGRSPWGRGGRTFPHMKNRGRHEPLLDRSIENGLVRRQIWKTNSVLKRGKAVVVRCAGGCVRALGGELVSKGGVDQFL
jgi:hypothetical protein